MLIDCFLDLSVEFFIVKTASPFNQLLDFSIIVIFHASVVLIFEVREYETALGVLATREYISHGIIIVVYTSQDVLVVSHVFIFVVIILPVIVLLISISSLVE